MAKSDDENLVLAESVDAVDEINARFYDRLPFPWLPMKFDYLTDPYFEVSMLNQNIGAWGHTVVPKNPRIWVAGCGTSQAIFTALRFPKATVLGSDLSGTTLRICAGIARNLGISNLELRKESINHVTYNKEFDYIICTAVISHTADPTYTLSKLADALKPTGILELMVANRYHGVTTIAFQKAIRILGGTARAANFEAELAIAKKLIDQFPTENLMSKTLSQFRDCPESMLVELLQPVEHSYTVESMEDMAAACLLELVAPCINVFDKSHKTLSWNMEFGDAGLQDQYDSLPDSRRWQVTNLLLLERSPMLWFYLQRKDCGRQRKPEKQVCEEFLDTRFVKASTSQRSYILSDGGRYKLSAQDVPFPTVPPDKTVRRVFDFIDPTITMRDNLQRLGVNPSFQTVNQLRLKLTTSLFPYLKAVKAS